jgi:hypothetical protein
VSKKRKPQPVTAPWMPLRPVDAKPWDDAKRAALRADTIRRGLIPDDELDAFLANSERDAMEHEVWGNDRYLVHVERREDGSVHNLSLRRGDRKPIRDWRDLQRIKNEIAGYECEAVELFPADSRLVDSANQYWLWCLPPGQEFPFGFTTRFTGNAEVAGSRQRPVPADGSYTMKEWGS